MNKKCINLFQNLKFLHGEIKRSDHPEYKMMAFNFLLENSRECDDIYNLENVRVIFRNTTHTQNYIAHYSNHQIREELTLATDR